MVTSGTAGNIDKYKAGVVVKGYRQLEGIDYDKMFALTVRFESNRTLVATEVAYRWNFDRMDVSTAFL